MDRKIITLVALTAFVWLGFAGGRYFQTQFQKAYGEIPDTPDAKQIMAVMDKAYELLGNVSRSFDVSELPSVFIDTKDYKLTNEQRKTIADELGVSLADVKNAGYLTAMQAKYTSLEKANHGQVPSPSSPITTPTQLTFNSIEMKGDKAFVEYDDGAALQNAILVKVDGRWFISSIVPIWVHF